MALFSKKITLEDILKALPTLSDDEKKALHEKMGDLYKAEDEREIDKIEEEKADTDTEADDKAEDVKDESEEIGKDVDEIEEDAAEDGDTEAEEAEEEKEDGDEEAEEDGAEPYELEEEKDVEVNPDVKEHIEPSVKDNTDQVLETLGNKVSALEQTVAELNALKEEMEKYVEKQKEAFGYKGNPNPGKKDYSDMSAAELKADILKH